MQRKKSSLLLIMILFCCIVKGQQFKNSAPLDVVKQDGFYSIPITAELSRYLKADLSDIRIADEKGQWIPHIVNWPLKNVHISTLLTELPIARKQKTSTSTILVLNNIGKSAVGNMFINVKSTVANRNAIVSGSDDQENWFAITDTIPLKPDTVDNKPALAIFFPTVNYNYFKVVIYNSKNDPYNITGVVYRSPAVVPDLIKRQKFITNPPVRVSQRDSAGFSLLRIENPEYFHFDRLRIHVSSPHFFDRRAKFFAGTTAKTFSSLQTQVPTNEYILSSGNEGEYNTSWMKDSILFFLIDNKDNPPLKIDSVITMQTSKELIAYLEKGKQYKLLFNDPGAKAPDYDLQKFSSRIPDSLTALVTGKISAVNEKNVAAKKPEQNFWQRWMWPVIIFVLVILLYFTFSLTKDVKKQNSPDDRL